MMTTDDRPPTTFEPSPKRGRWALVAAAAVVLAGGGFAAGFAVGESGDTAPAATTAEPAPAPAPAQEPPMEEPPDLEQPVPEDQVDLGSRDVEGEPAPPGMIDTIEGMSIPDGAVTVTDATMILYQDAYYIVAALAETPDGTQVLTYLHAPWDQAVVDGAGQTETLNEAAQEWAPMAPASDDVEALELGDRLMVGQP